MIKRLKTSTGVAAGIAALALGGAAIAGAASTTLTPVPTQESTTALDRDNTQSGSKETPDPKGNKETPDPKGSNETPDPKGSNETPDPKGSNETPDPKGTAPDAELPGR